MIIWQGLGAYAFAIPFFVWIGALVAARALLGVQTATEYGQIINGLVLLVSAALVYLMSQRLDAQPGREVIDKATGQEITLRQPHTMFYVRLRYWAMLYAVVGAILLVVGTVGVVGS
jgi:uncharacterized membrane protein